MWARRVMFYHTSGTGFSQSSKHPVQVQLALSAYRGRGECQSLGSHTKCQALTADTSK